MKYDLIFYNRFGLKTKITYFFDVITDKKHEKDFIKTWKKFYLKDKCPLSHTRKKLFEAFFKRLKKRQSDQAYCDRVSIRFIDSDMGYGVFAKKNIPRYSILNHYAGLLRKDKEVSDDNDSTFVFPDFNKYSIDAQNHGNWTRFMNHSDNANVMVWEYFLPDGPRLIFTAGPKGIKKNEQLTYSYGDIYWEEEED
jgi:hypothetical protein